MKRIASFILAMAGFAFADIAIVAPPATVSGETNAVAVAPRGMTGWA